MRGDHDPRRDHVFGAEPVERGAGDDRECGVGVIVQAEQRADAQGGQAERAGQFGHHHAGRRTQRILAEIEQQAEAPGEDVSGVAASSGRHDSGGRRHKLPLIFSLVRTWVASSVAGERHLGQSRKLLSYIEQVTNRWLGPGA